MTNNDDQLVYCTCCENRPRALFVLGPDAGLIVRRNKGRSNTHVASLCPLDVLQQLVGSSDPIEIERFVQGILETSAEVRIESYKDRNQSVMGPKG